MKKMRNQVAACIICEMLFTSTMAFMGTTYILFLRHIGLSYLQIGLINIGCIIGMNLVNTPAGAFADRYGRKASFIIGCILNFIAISAYYFASNFIGAMIVEVLAGVALAFYADSLNALIVCRAKDNGGNVNKILSKISMYNNIVMLVGGSLGAIVAKNSLGIPFLIGGVASIVAGVFAWIAVEEDKHILECSHKYSLLKTLKPWWDLIDGSVTWILPKSAEDITKSEQRIRNALRDIFWNDIIRRSYYGMKEVFANRSLLILLLMMVVISVNGQIFVKMFTPHLRSLLPSQSETPPEMSWIWAILMAGCILGGFTSYCARARRLKPLLAAFQMASAVPLIFCAMLPGLGAKVACLTVFEAIHAGIKPIMNTKKNECIANHNRATVLSAFSTLASIGSILGLLAGLLADKTSIPFTWISVGCTTTILSVILSTIFLKSKAPHS